jgi:hypothetical protein
MIGKSRREGLSIMEEKKNLRFEEIARELKPIDPDVSAAWRIVLIGLDTEMLTVRELKEVYECLKENVGRGFDEFDFDPHFPDGEIRVSLLDEEVFCSKELFIEHLGKVLHSYNESS